MLIATQIEPERPWRLALGFSPAAVKPPALGQWHTLQISAKRGRLQGWLNDQHLIDHSDSRFTAGRIGLWTKADSVTAFDSLNVLPIEGG